MVPDGLVILNNAIPSKKLVILRPLLTTCTKSLESQNFVTFVLNNPFRINENKEIEHQ